ncbi:PREDICTED: lanosterol synthase-like [Priapulus caudatus]|uniref:Terpene cyclase/mutase family member n=1 Tax=Priapulus caudatus TaxID=37621 RepID=A0ABM1EZV0_PRICU|nr:PREDICTED: lanosterol synthase-like [Priapulus caudatus]
MHRYENTMRRNRGIPRVTPPATDLSRWRLTCVDGRQTWRYHDDDNKPDRAQTPLERHSLGVATDSDRTPATTAADAARRAAEFYCSIQAEDGHWAGDYGGPLFLLPVLIIVCHFTGAACIAEPQRKEILRYLRSVQCPDGGWGLHVAGPPTVFGCTMNYIAMRLLGVAAGDPDLVRARELRHTLGGATAIPSWGKFWLCLLNVYHWEGMHSLLPEMWLAPTWLPVHPSKLWCHCRQVYLPMAYCYGARIQHPETELIRALRKELYICDAGIDWPSQRNNCAPSDLYTPHTRLLDCSYVLIDMYEAYHNTTIRKMALSELYQHICAEDQYTNYISIGPISKVLNMLVRWSVDGADSAAFRRHVSRVDDYLWMGVDGMKMTGTNGSQLWDTAFAASALCEADTAFAASALCEAGAAEAPSLRPSLRRARSFIERMQVRDALPDGEKYYRHPPLGGFPFSTRDCGWIVSDCTAEALRALLELREHCRGDDLAPVVDDDRLRAAADSLLSFANPGGGVATYETTRGSGALEWLNPSEVFGDIMIDHPHVECTSAAATALSCFRRAFPAHRPADVDAFIQGALGYVRGRQRADGSWEGAWAVCFTYATWFALEALTSAGRCHDDAAVAAGCEFLVSRQRADGGWGEAFESCEQRRYVAAARPQVAQTCWALLGLMAARWPDARAIERGVGFLVRSQLPSGDWPADDVVGVFNRSCGINYASYRNVFPIWTLGRFCRLYPDHAFARDVGGGGD